MEGGGFVGRGLKREPDLYGDRHSLSSPHLLASVRDQLFEFGDGGRHRSISKMRPQS
jgi:hypothetical protein